MSIPTLTPLGLYVAIKTDKQIVQIFKRDFTKTFFMLKEDHERESADENSSLNILSTVTITKSFDSRAFFEFENRLFTRYGTRAAYEYKQLPAIEYVERMYDGIQIVHEYQDIVPDFYTREDTERLKEKDFLPEHFLKGTQVTASPMIAQMYRDYAHPSVFTVQGIIQNGPNSFLIETTSDDLSSIMPEGTKYCFNISHVENIVSQGKGAIAVDPWSNVDYGQILKFQDASKSYPKYARKNHWLVYGDGGMFVTALASKLSIPRGSVVEGEVLMHLLLGQTFVKKITLGHGGFITQRLFLINKKRAKSFIKKNLNRFLSSAKKAQQEYDDEMEKYYYDEMEKDLDREIDFTIKNEQDKTEALNDEYNPFDYDGFSFYD